MFPPRTKAHLAQVFIICDDDDDNDYWTAAVDDEEKLRPILLFKEEMKWQFK